MLSPSGSAEGGAWQPREPSDRKKVNKAKRGKRVDKRVDKGDKGDEDDGIVRAKRVEPTRRRLPRNYDGGEDGDADEPDADDAGAKINSIDKQRYYLRRSAGSWTAGQLGRVIAELRAGGAFDNPEDCREALRALGKKKRIRHLWKEAVALISDMRSGALDVELVHLKPAITCCRKARQWEHALSLFVDARRLGALDSVAYNEGIMALGVGGLWEAALDLFQECRDTETATTKYLYSSAVGACENAGQWRHALGLIEDLIGRGMEPDVVLYTSVISACEKGGQIEWVEDVLRDMFQQKVNPNVITYNSAIRAFGTSGRWSQAFDLLLLMEDQGIEKTILTYNSLLLACKDGLLWDKADEFWQHMKRNGPEPNVNSYITMVEICDRVGKPEMAWELLLDGLEIGLDKNVLANIQAKGRVAPLGAYLAALMSYRATSSAKGVVRLIGEMENIGYPVGAVVYKVAAEVSQNCDSPQLAEELREFLAKAGLSDNPAMEESEVASPPWAARM